ALLADATRLLGESLDTEQVISAIARMAVPTFAAGTLVYLRNAATGALDLTARHPNQPELDAVLPDLTGRPSFPGRLPAHQVLRSGKSERHAVLTPDWLSSEDTDNRIIPLVRRFHVSTLIFVPLVVDTARIGVVAFFGTRPRRFSEGDLAFAEELARRAG